MGLEYNMFMVSQKNFACILLERSRRPLDISIENRIGIGKFQGKVEKSDIDSETLHNFLV